MQGLWQIDCELLGHQRVFNRNEIALGHPYIWHKIPMESIVILVNEAAMCCRLRKSVITAHNTYHPNMMQLGADSMSSRQWHSVLCTNESLFCKKF